MGIKKRYRQAHDVVIATSYLRHKPRSPTLNSIGSGFVTRLPASSVLLNFLFCQHGKRNLGRREILNRAIPVQDANASVYEMIATRQEAEHALGVFVIARFAKHFVVQANDGVRGQNDIARLPM